MTKPTESKVPAAFQAMLAFLQMMTRGFFSHSGEQPAVIGVQAVDAITSYYREHPRLIALRDLVQAAADEHAAAHTDGGSPCARCGTPVEWNTGNKNVCDECWIDCNTSPAAPNAAGGIFDRLSEIKESHAQAGVAFTGAACTNAHLERGWLIGEVERLRAIERCGDPMGVLQWSSQNLPALPPRSLADQRLDQEAAQRNMARQFESLKRRPLDLSTGSAPDGHDASGFAVHIGVDPSHEGDHTVTQVREPAFDRLAAAVDALRPHCEGRLLDVTQAFDAFVAARAAEVEPATPAETLTFTCLKGETPEQFRARIALHLNGLGSARYVLPGQDGTREALGEIVYRVRRQWADEGSTERYSFTRWADRTAAERDLDCRIGVALATVGQSIAGAIDAPVLTEEAAQKWTGEVVNAFKDGHDERDEAIAEALLAASRGEYPKT